MLTAETVIPLMDGRRPTIKELSETYNRGEGLEVYSVDSEGRNVKGTIVWASQVDDPKTPVFKIILDDGSFFRATGSHRLRLMDDSCLTVDHLESGDELRTTSLGSEDAQLTINKILHDGFEAIYDLEMEELNNFLVLTSYNAGVQSVNL